MKNTEPRSNVPFCGESRDLGMGLTIRLMTITPDVAEQWRQKVHPKNRNTSPKRVERYATDMANGKFTLNDQAISFDTEGYMVNGAHRLGACVLSGKAFLSLVLRGLPHESFRNLDGVKARTTDDNAKISGVDMPFQAGATCRRMMLGFTNSTYGVTDEMVFEWMEKYGKAVRFAHQHLLRGSRACSSITRAVVARAHACKHPRGKLARFCEVMVSGLSVPGEEMVIRLRNYIIGGENKAKNSRSYLYSMIEWYLLNFINEEVDKKFKSPTKELFPLAEDE